MPQALTISQSVYILNIFISWETCVRNYILTSKFWLSLVWMLTKEPLVLKMLLFSDKIEGDIFFLLLSSRDQRFSKMLICSLFSINSCDIPGTKYFSNISDNETEQENKQIHAFSCHIREHQLLLKKLISACRLHFIYAVKRKL